MKIADWYKAVAVTYMGKGLDSLDVREEECDFLKLQVLLHFFKSVGDWVLGGRFFPLPHNPLLLPMHELYAIYRKTGCACC